MTQTAWPAPDEVALTQSRNLLSVILQEITPSGWLPFSTYMERALYAPGLGYYSGGATKLGEAGDFTTAPQMTPLFGQLIARQIAQVQAQLHGDILEIGAGSGRLAHDMLIALDSLGQLPGHYWILEVSADLRARQQQTIADLPDHLASKVSWLETLPAPFEGVILGNEVLDAMPVELVRWTDTGLFRRGLVNQNGALAWHDQPLMAGELHTAATELQELIGPLAPQGYTSEIHLAAAAFVRTLCACLSRGVMLFIDYGFGAGEYYHPQRAQGTLMCHYRHHAHDDPLYLPGLQDITAHVDFSRMLRAAQESGLDLAGYTTQAHFLINCGLDAVLMALEPGSAAWLREVSMVQKLISPAEMGELFKVIAFARGDVPPLSGFASGDRSRML